MGFQRQVQNLTTRQAVILAGGLGTRIASLSGGLPKALLPIAGRPFLHHLLEYLAGQGISRALLLLGVGADKVIAAANDVSARNLAITTAVEPEPLGTGGALRHALALLDDRFFLVNGDTFLRTRLSEIDVRHLSAPVPVATLALTRFADAGQKGSVELNEEGFITRFLEKGKVGPGLINAGVYLIEKGGVRDIPAGRPVSLERDILPAWINRGGHASLRGVVTDAYFVDIGLPEDYLGVIDGFPKES
ncbi:MAG TPA: sugar phosphate nucleotidyltransferase [Candidatus Eisenbacteria bacterium]